MFCNLFSLYVLLCMPLGMRHDDLSHRIEALTKRIVADPANAELFLLRGEYRRLEKHASAALEDFQRAEDLGGGQRRLRLARARTYIQLGELRVAECLLDQHVAGAPDDGEALFLWADALAERQDFAGALRLIERAMQVSLHVEPDAFVRRAWMELRAGELRAGEGGVDGGLGRALHGLDEALQRMGPLHSLQQLAIELECRRGSYALALARLETLTSTGRPRPDLLLQRGEISLLAGDERAALEAFRCGRRALSGLNPRRRHTASSVELARKLEHHIRSLTQPSTPSGH